MGGITLSGFLAVAGCYLLGCCGSPMLAVYMSLFGVSFLRILGSSLDLGPAVLGLVEGDSGNSYSFFVCKIIKTFTCCLLQQELMNRRDSPPDDPRCYKRTDLNAD